MNGPRRFLRALEDDDDHACSALNLAAFAPATYAPARTFSLEVAFDY